MSETVFKAVEIVAALRSGASTAVAVAKEALARIDAYASVQPAVWITRRQAEDVLADAAAVDRRLAEGEELPLAGVPFAIKDNIDLADMPTTAACPDFAYTPAISAKLVQTLIQAGAIPLGKTNLDQFATGLNGTRSPYGTPACVYNRDYISGGSSSGSAVSVAAGLVAFALGTDTAGSGRVPAAFNHLVGLKPTKGRWSTSGVVPACRSLDCVTVLTHDLDDARLVDQVVTGFDPADAYSRPAQVVPLPGRRLGVPLASQRQFLGDAASARLYDAALAAFVRAGATLVEIDIEPLQEAAQLLYGGPWVAERTAAAGEFLRDHPDAIDPSVRAIMQGGLNVSAVDAFKGAYRLAELRRLADLMWEKLDMLVLPTAPTIYRITDMRADPIRLNSHLGLYTNFVNLLDMAALALPAGFRETQTGFGITLIGPAWTEGALMDMGQAYLASAALPSAPPLDVKVSEGKVTLAVVGAHLEGMPLHWQLTSRGAKKHGPAMTAPTYRLYAMAGSTPPKPALVYAQDGDAIALELYELELSAFGSFVAEVPAPLAIGTVTLADGSQVKGFVAEPRAVENATDITAWRGWRAYIGSL